MNALPEIWKGDLPKTAQAPDAIRVITRIYIKTGISIDFK